MSSRSISSAHVPAAGVAPGGPPPADPIDADTLLARTGLATFEHHRVLASTMDRGRTLAGDPATPLPAAVVADEQTLGRGQRGARWWQAPGSLAVSVVVEAVAAPGGAPPLWSLACGVAVAEAVAAVVPGVEPLVRWPNDVEVDGRKLAGMLVEVASGGRVVFGIGVNTHGSRAAAPPPLDARIVTVPDLVGGPLPRQRLLVELLPRLFRLLEATAGDPRECVARYRARCGLDGRPVTVHRAVTAATADGPLTGICRGVAADGALVLDTVRGRVLVTSGSLTAPADVWRGESGLRPAPAPQGDHADLAAAGGELPGAGREVPGAEAVEPVGQLRRP